MDSVYLPKSAFPEFFSVLQQEGYQIVGPQVKDGAIVYNQLSDVDQLPFNYTDDQQAGTYQIADTKSGKYFSWANGPQALKPLTFSPRETLWSVVKDNLGKLSFNEELPNVQPTAVLGIRACDLAALTLQDQHFLQGEFQDDYFKKRSEKLLLIAVNCSHPAQTCFCASTGDGPEAKAGYDIVMTELDHGFILQAATGVGATICAQLPSQNVSSHHEQQKEAQIQNAVAKQTRQLPKSDLKDLLPAQWQSTHWDSIAQRCLACGNCTAVCPTCFCHSEWDDASLDGQQSVHYRQWDSCFNHEHSYIHGIVIRAETGNKYRQWLTHKFATWFEQYGRSGCVGCGRCITWCPVGIDVTEELKKLSESVDATE